MTLGSHSSILLLDKCVIHSVRYFGSNRSFCSFSEVGTMAFVELVHARELLALSYASHLSVNVHESGPPRQVEIRAFHPSLSQPLSVRINPVVRYGKSFLYYLCLISNSACCCFRAHQRLLNYQVRKPLLSIF